MQKLSEALPNMPNIALGKMSNTSNTQAHGLTGDVGKMNMEPEKTNPLGLPKLNASQKNIVESKQPWMPQDRANLMQALSRVCALQRQYGKTSAELETLVEGFAWALADYSTEQVVQAIGKYIKKNPNIPTPSEICTIIDPPKPEWHPDRTYYQRLIDLRNAHGAYALSEDEELYVARYEKYMRGE